MRWTPSGITAARRDYSDATPVRKRKAEQARGITHLLAKEVGLGVQVLLHRRADIAGRSPGASRRALSRGWGSLGRARSAADARRNAARAAPHGLGERHGGGGSERLPAGGVRLPSRRPAEAESTRTLGACKYCQAGGQSTAGATGLAARPPAPGCACGWEYAPPRTLGPAKSTPLFETLMSASTATRRSRCCSWVSVASPRLACCLRPECDDSYLAA